MNLRSRRGTAILETAMTMPMILLLLVGMGQLAKITYTYYTLRKTVYAIATYLSTQQAVNFCDPADATITSAINFGITGTTDGSQPSFVTGLSPSMIRVSAESLDPLSGAPTAYQCVSSLNFSGNPPDQIVVSIPDGYVLQPRIPFLPVDAIPFKPQVKVPYAGT